MSKRLVLSAMVLGVMSGVGVASSHDTYRSGYRSGTSADREYHNDLRGEHRSYHRDEAIGHGLAHAFGVVRDPYQHHRYHRDLDWQHRDFHYEQRRDHRDFHYDLSRSYDRYDSRYGCGRYGY